METKMQIMDFFKRLKILFSFNNIISISGESGTGKTTLVLHMIGDLLDFQDSCIWIQAGEQFPLRRLGQLFENSQDKKEYIKEHIFVFPNDKKLNSYEEQCHTLQYILDPNTILPPSLSYIVIDNISHHLRYKLSQYSSIKDKMFLLDGFYDDYLMPLILFCKKNNIVLILIHELSYSPILDKNRPFFYKLYDRLDMIDITLKNTYNDEKKDLEASYHELIWNFPYVIKQHGITIKS
jgi:hypothetical protein